MEIDKTINRDPLEETVTPTPDSKNSLATGKPRQAKPTPGNLIFSKDGTKVPKRETLYHIIHEEPRLSAVELAHYMVADDGRRATILKNAKVAKKIQMSSYAATRAALAKAHTEDGLSAEKLKDLADKILKDAYGPKETADANLNAAAIRHLANFCEKIDCGGSVIPRPQKAWGGIQLSGVKVSIDPNLVFSIQHRGVTKAGAIILNVSKKPDTDLSRTAREFTAGDYLTALLYRLCEMRFQNVPPVIAKQCIAVDVFREEIYHASPTWKKLLNEMDSACKVIAAMWPLIPDPAENQVEEEAEF